MLDDIFELLSPEQQSALAQVSQAMKEHPEQFAHPQVAVEQPAS